MALFGKEANIKKYYKVLSLYDMNQVAFPESLALQSALDEYLKNRKEQRNMPSKISWQKNLDLLKKLPTEEQMVLQVNKAILHGWRAVAFEDMKIDNNVVKRSTKKSKEVALSEMKRNEEF